MGIPAVLKGMGFDEVTKTKCIEREEPKPKNRSLRDPNRRWKVKSF